MRSRHARATDSMFLDAEVVTLQSDGNAAFVRTYRRVLGTTSTEIGNTTFAIRFERAGSTITLITGVEYARLAGAGGAP